MEELDHDVVALVLDLPIEAVHLVHVDALVVAARQEEVVRVEQLGAGSAGEKSIPVN